MWDIDNNGKPVLLKPKYFSEDKNGKKICFHQDFYVKFLKRYAVAIQEANPNLIFLFEPVPNEEPPKLDQAESWHKNCIYAPHWYDLDSVFHKRFSGFMTHDVQGLSKGTRNVFQASYFGVKGARRNYAFQVGNVKKHGLHNLGEKPCLIGECGIPMDINEKKVFQLY